MTEPFNQAQFIAERFGGRGQLSDAIDVSRKTVDYWCRVTRFIPEEHRPAVLEAAWRLKVDVTPFDFIRHLVAVPTAALAAG
jgi:hypothetical protein